MIPRLMRYLALLTAAAAVGYLLERLHVPLPWMIGPMLLSAGLALARRPVPTHKYYRPAGQVVVATAVGLYFTEAAVVVLLDQVWLMLTAALLTIVGGFAVAAILIRLGRTDGTTAFFAALPGGPVEMAILAERNGARGTPVALSQTMRIVAIVMLIPPILVFFDGGGSAYAASAEIPVSWPGLAALLALAIGAALAIQRTGLPNGFFLGPLGAAAVLTASGIWLSSIPPFLLAAGQIVLGISLGARFDREDVLHNRRFAWAAAFTTLLLLTITSAVALALWTVSSETLPTLVLATAPGSITEMALTAKLLEQAVASVTAFHLVRIFVIIPFAPAFYRLFRAIMKGRVVFHGETK